MIAITWTVLQSARITECQMRAPYGLNIIDNCLTCQVREEHLFCNLSRPAVQKLNEIKSTAVYPKSAMLFIESQQPRGVFVLCTRANPHVSSQQPTPPGLTGSTTRIMATRKYHPPVFPEVVESREVAACDRHCSHVPIT